MTLRISLYVGLTSLVATGAAWAQTQSAGETVEIAIGYQGLPARSPARNQGGLHLSESALLHVGVGAELGYDSNVFYGETDIRGSAILRVVPFLEITNLGRGGTVQSDMSFDLGAALTYREYLSNDPLIRNQRALMPSAFGILEFGTQQSLGFGVADTYTRTEDPPYLTNLGAGPFVRDVNQFAAKLRWAPGGGRLAGTVIYSNTLDWFETNSLRVANSMGHLVTVDASWKWLPKTALILQVSEGYVSYFNTNAMGEKKPTSFPLHALVGLRGLLTAKTTVNVALGYANGFYEAGHRGPSGLRGNLSAMADVTFRPTILTSLALGYRHDFQNAILGDFYYLDAVYLNIGQAIAGRLGAGVSARYESRTFQDIPLANGVILPSRHDDYFQAGANLDYHIRDWTYVGLAYTVMSNSSAYTQASPMDPGRVNYVKHLAFARLGVTY